MKLYYYEHANFGDALNPYLWEALLPGRFDGAAQTLFLGIGTLLNNGVPRNAEKLVFGSGAGYGSALPSVDGRWHFFWVRGPLTARALQLESSVALSDGALLLGTLPLPPVNPSYPISFMPHWKSTEFWNWKTICDAVGLNYIDPCTPVPQVLDQIRGSKLLITEALHGAIVADTFRIPWVPVRAYRTVLETKWQDWCGSLGLTYKPIVLPALYSEQSFVDKFKRGGKWLALPAQMVNPLLVARTKHVLGQIANNPRPFLSQEETLNQVIVRMQEQLERFKREYRGS